MALALALFCVVCVSVFTQRCHNAGWLVMVIPWLAPFLHAVLSCAVINLALVLVCLCCLLTAVVRVGWYDMLRVTLYTLHLCTHFGCYPLLSAHITITIHHPPSHHHAHAQPHGAHPTAGGIRFYLHRVHRSAEFVVVLFFFVACIVDS
jgi:hypothetical protein